MPFVIETGERERKVTNAPLSLAGGRRWSRRRRSEGSPGQHENAPSVILYTHTFQWERRSERAREREREKRENCFPPSSQSLLELGAVHIHPRCHNSLCRLSDKSETTTTELESLSSVLCVCRVSEWVSEWVCVWVVVSRTTTTTTRFTDELKGSNSNKRTTPSFSSYLLQQVI